MNDLITVDIGGTSCDIALVPEASPWFDLKVGLTGIRYAFRWLM
ncbi:MAG: hypothetical protein CM1200mP41_20930 [Gammaproteobacteria bacterium]|nr:MAG: hypothetical protein CM1200mP41_20930 [Gammaproteobacteria bacterium]